MSETISRPYTFAEDGVFYFSRRIPQELRQHYTSPRIAYSLRTKSPKIAEARARRAADQLDEYWYYLRCKVTELPGKHMLRQKVATRPDGPEQQPVLSASIKLSEAVFIYLQLKGRNRPATFHRAAERACGYVIDACGDKDLQAYTKADANAFRDALIVRGLAGSSMTRVFGTVRAVTNFAASEHCHCRTEWYAADKAMQHRTRQLWDRGLQSIETIVQRQQSMSSECENSCFLGFGQDR